MWVNKGKEKNALTLVGLELVTPGQEARVLTIRPPVPPFGHGRNIDRLKYIAYDRICDLHPFLCNLQANLADFLLKNVKFLVDMFHVEGHTEACCKPPSDCDPQRGRYHPLHTDFDEIRHANTECAEQSFKWLNKYKNIVRNMKQHRFNFFLHNMINLHNSFRESQLKVQGHM